ncbi:MAG: hypothetical protein Tsb0033_26980 [Winogradskyella sp.]
MKTKILLLFILLGFLNSCNSDNGSENQIVEVNFEDIGNNVLFGNGVEGINQGNYIITNQTDWQALKDQMNAVNNTTDNFNDTNINFENDFVIGVFLDVRDSGWQVEIIEVLENENSILITTEENPSTITVITQAFHIIKIPKTEKDIVFN